MKQIEAAKLILDYSLYPRCQIDNQHAGYMVESLKAGQELPPIIVDEKSLRVIDGFHRVSAIFRHFGEVGKIACILKNYRSEKEMFIDSMKYNASHGRMLTQYDRTHCILRAEELKIDPETIASSLNITTEKVGELHRGRVGELHTKIAVTTSNKQKSALFDKKVIPLKRTIEHMAGRRLTQSQAEANEKLSGMNQAFYVNQLILLIEGNLLNMKNEVLMERLNTLQALLTDVLAVQKKRAAR